MSGRSYPADFVGMHSCFHGCRIAVTGAMGLDYNPAVRAVQPGNGDYGDLGSRGRVIGPDSKEGNRCSQRQRGHLFPFHRKARCSGRFGI